MSFEQVVGEKENRLEFLTSTPPMLPRQVVTLAFLSKHLPSALMSAQLAASLCAESSGVSVVLVRLQPSERPPSFLDAYDEGRATAVDWAPSEVMLQGQFGMPSSLIRTETGFHLLTLNVHGETSSPENIASLVAQLRRQFRYVLVEALADETPTPGLLEFLVQSDLAYLFLQGTTEDVYHVDLLIRKLRPRCQKPSGCFKPILCLAEGEQANGFDLLIQRVATPVHMYVRQCPTAAAGKDPGAPGGLTSLFKADLRRLAREISGRLLGLALSSGAAKGFSHIGVIQVLEENGIEVDVVAGASIGAYIGSVWAYGHDGREMERLAREMEGRWRLWSVIDPVFPPRQGFLRGLALKRRLMRSIGTSRFADLQRPLRVVAGNLVTLERTVFASGEVATAVHASIAVPGICVPVTIDGETYIDGGVVDPVPVDILREMGVSRIIAVNAIPTPDRIRYSLQAEQELARAKAGRGDRARRLFRKVVPLEQQLNYFARGNLFEIVMRSVHGAQVRLAEASCGLADVALRPDICDDRWLDCRNPGRFIALGRDVAERHLEEIKALVARKEPNHEREHTPRPMAAVA
jgi:NTE family protein